MSGRWGSLVILLAVMCGCSPVGPNYTKPDVAVPHQFGSLESGISTGQEPGKSYTMSWWTVLEDPMLNSLVERAIQGNPDMRIVIARVQQARALSMRADALLLPDGGFTGSYQRFRRSESGSSGQSASGGGSSSAADSARENNLFLAGFDASWEIDIVGGLRREIEATDADLAATEDTLRDTVVTLQGEVARTYIECRGLQLRLEIARREVVTWQENVEIGEARLRAGLINELDVTRAKGELASAQARVPLLENILLMAVHRLGVLLGLEPFSLQAELRQSVSLPFVPENLPAGLPSDLVRRRPDIRRAERELAAATARIGVATADLFPRFSLTGSFGYQADSFDRLFRDSANFWSIGPAVRWPIINFKRILATIDASKAVREEVLARYEKNILKAFEEVENALVNLSREKRRALSLADSVRHNELAVTLAKDRYRAGLASYLAVLDAEVASYTAQDQLAQSRQNQVLAFVALYKALGGGWLDYYGE